MSDSDDSKWREWSELDDLYGEWIARDLDQQMEEDKAHERLHHPTLIDRVVDHLSGVERQCDDPTCEAEAMESADGADSPSWWERWFLSADTGDGGEGGPD
jgi:hypothetical protein